MKETPITYRPIGVIRSGHTRADETPIQPVYAHGCQGRAEIEARYAEGLRDLDGFSHVYLLCHFHRAGPPRLLVKPYLQDVERGIFATRAPVRPNAIGLSVVRLLRREDNLLHLDDLDILDGTPLLDIKPYTAKFDRIATTSNGWQDEVVSVPVPVVDRDLCDGCGACARFCPQAAIDLRERACGEWMVSTSRCGPMVHARLGVGGHSRPVAAARCLAQARRTKTRRYGQTEEGHSMKIAIPLAGTLQPGENACDH